MSESDAVTKCECGKTMSRDFVAENPSRIVCDTYPYNSLAMGVNPNQVGEFMEFDRKHGVSTTYDRDGCPEFRSKGHRKAYCEAHGVVDRNAGYGDPQNTKRH